MAFTVHARTHTALASHHTDPYGQRAACTAPPQWPLQPTAAAPAGLIDIGANLLDTTFQGEYRGKQAHPPDLRAVLERAAASGVSRCIVTAGSLEESKAAVQLVRATRQSGAPVSLSCTVGVHPTRALEWLPTAARATIEAALAVVAAAEGGPATAAAAATAALDAAEADALAHPQTTAACAEHARALRALIADGTADGSVVAVGECGLDYDRLQFCPAGVQHLAFELQLEIAGDCGLPLFLHNRNARADFGRVCAARRGALVRSGGGVVHSFDGGAEEMRELVDLGLEIGLNGCSLKTAANLEVAAQVPLCALHLETDAPWCSVKRTHAGHAHTRPVAWPEAKKAARWEEGHVVKDRCEPCHLVHVLQVVAAVRGEDEAVVAAAATHNSVRRFFSSARR